DVPRFIPFRWSAEEGLYSSKTTWTAFVSLLCALQVIQIIWFGMICRVAWRVLTTDSGASDDRSDEEGDEKED
ncbi:hypothetical protein E4T56_gene17378, partial [Termitomyces sp. T112]